METSSSSGNAPPEELMEPPVPSRPSHRRRSLVSLLPWLFSVLTLVAGLGAGLVLYPILEPAAADTTNTYPILKLLLAQTRHFRGSANAPVTLIEFSDFQ